MASGIFKNSITGEINNRVYKVFYDGKVTETSEIIIDNENEEISANVLKTPGTLSFRLDNNIVRQFDGSKDEEVSLLTYGAVLKVTPVIKEQGMLGNEYELGLYNAAGDLLGEAQYIDVNNDTINDAQLDFINKKLIFTRVSGEQFSCDITSLIDDYMERLTALRNELEQEKEERRIADEAEAARAEVAEHELENQIASEKEARDLADIELNKRIDDETNARINRDSELAVEIDEKTI